MVNIIQWNLNGFYSKFEELQLLTKHYIPTIICLQVTNFTDSNKPSLSQYNIYKKKPQYLCATEPVAV